MFLLENFINSSCFPFSYFIDVRLYNKAKLVVDPFAFERFRKEKIRQEIESERQPRLQIKSKLPKVNQELALKLLDEETAEPKAGKAKKQTGNLLQDDRFKAMFENTDFEINKNAEQYKLLAPVLNRLEKSKLKEIKRRIEVAPAMQLQADEAEPHVDSDDDDDLFGFDRHNEAEKNSDSEEAESSDDENVKEFAKEMKKAYKDVKKQRQHEDDMEDEPMDEQQQADEATTHNPFSTKTEFKLKTPKSANDLNLSHTVSNRVSLMKRVQHIDQQNANISHVGRSLGNRQMTFDLKKPASRESKKREYEMKKHREERKKIIRPIRSLKLKKPNFK